jgi:hypothetical protein
MARAWDTLAAIACAVALVAALRAVRGLEWPPDEDNFRDVAAAQAALDGDPLSDPYYANEWIWYNPLVPWLVALGAAITGAPASLVDIQAGPWLNLLAPIGFYLVSARIAGRASACIALILFLFWNGGFDGMASATYLPWLWVGNFSQGPFYFALLAILWCIEKPSPGRAAISGVLGGLTFLTHTGPALVVGLVALATLPMRLVAVAGVCALVIAGPFLYSIVGQYHLRILNDAPLAWRYPYLTPEGLPDLLRANAAVVAAGLVGTVWLRHRFALAWLLVSAALLAYGLSRELVPDVPPIVPSFHFWRCMLGALTLFTGVAIWHACRALGERRAYAAVAAVAAATVWFNFSRYEQRSDYIRDLTKRRDRREVELAAALREGSQPRDVVLGSPFVSLQVVGPSGRKAVAVGAMWSNPYVSLRARQRDQEAMLTALRDRDQQRFKVLAGHYGVTRVVGMGDECRHFNGPPLTLVSSLSDSCVFMVQPAAPQD